MVFWIHFYSKYHTQTSSGSCNVYTHQLHNYTIVGCFRHSLSNVVCLLQTQNSRLSFGVFGFRLFSPCCCQLKYTIKCKKSTYTQKTDESSSIRQYFHIWVSEFRMRKRERETFLELDGWLAGCLATHRIVIQHTQPFTHEDLKNRAHCILNSINFEYSYWCFTSVRVNKSMFMRPERSKIVYVICP